MRQINIMLLEEYPYKNRKEDVVRIEDEYPYGFELYRADTVGASLVCLCIKHILLCASKMRYQDVDGEKYWCNSTVRLPLIDGKPIDIHI